MSQSEYCCVKKYNSFSNLKKELKKILKDNFKNFIEDYLENDAVYFGLSIYKKRYEYNKEEQTHNLYYYDVLYSASIYTNENKKYTISENDFSGFVFDTISEQELTDAKLHKYLNIFFKDIHTKLISDNKNIYFIKPIKIDDDYILQLYLVSSKDSMPNYLKKVIKEKLNNIVKEKKKIIECIPYSDIRMIFKKGILKTNNEIILIMDLIRIKERTEKKYVNMDSVLTSKLIYELKDIAGGLNFKTINHTGDGFVFIYRGEKENIGYDIRLLIERAFKKMNDFQDFLQDLNNIASSYKVRAIISNCDILYEMDYINSIDKKLYFSSYLDMIFEDMFKIKDYETKCMENTNIFFLIRDNILNNNDNIKQEDYTICNIKENDSNLYITGIKG